MSTVIPLHSPSAAAIPSVASQQAIENALSMALYLIRLPRTESGLQAATGRAMRAASMLKQACAAEAATVRGA